MAEALLVGEQLTEAMVNSGAALVATLDRQSLLVKAAYWLYLTEQRVWRLVVVSPEVGVHGPRAVYGRIRAALTKLPSTVSSVESKDIVVVDTKDRFYLLLRTAVTTGPDISGMRFTRNTVNGHFIEDAYLYRVT